MPSEGVVRQFEPSNLEIFTEIGDYWGKREGLIFFPFDRNSNAYFFPLDYLGETSQEIQIASNEALSRAEYETSVMLAQLAMKEEDLAKVVLARNELIKGDFSAEDSFDRAVEYHSDSYCYFIDLGYEQWVGASPELLLHYEKGTVYTVALAGTKIIEDSFDDKEIKSNEWLKNL